MEKTNIDLAYDKLIEASESSDLDKAMEECLQSEEVQEVLESINETIDTPEGEKVMVATNPTTGMVSPTGELFADVSENNYQALVNDGNLEIPIESLKGLFSNEEFQNLEDMMVISKLIQRRINGEKFNPYNEFPAFLKAQCNSIMYNASMNVDPRVPKNMRNQVNKAMIANMLLDSLVEDYQNNPANNLDLDNLLGGFEDEIRKVTDEFASDLGEMMMSFDEERKAEIDAAIERCKAEGKTDSIAKLEEMKSTLSDAYELTGFKEACKSIKIKNYDMSEPDKVFNKFNLKYIDHKNTINDIRICPTILSTHLPQYSKEAALMVCLAFCKYCQNMSPDNMGEHTFMYYFVRNIIVLDRINPGARLPEAMNERSKNFYDSFLTNISECMDNISERNPKFINL